MTSWPAGRLSDRVPRERVLSLGIILLAVSHVTLSLATDVAWVLAGTALWGVHMGFTQGTVSAMLADRSPPAMRGTAFGVYATASGIALLMSGVAGGALWQSVSPAATFAMGAIAAVMSLVFLRTMK
jgi:MFS family permease